MDFLPRKSVLRGTAAVIVVALLLACAGLTLAYEPPELGAGSIEQAAESKTAVAIQGFHFQGKGNSKKPARLLMVNETGNFTELWNGSQRGASWFYDVDPLENGNLLMTTTNPPNHPPPGGTMIYEYDPVNESVVWNQSFDAIDTHDADMLNEHELIVANMRNGGESDTPNDDRLFIYNLTTDEVVWEWKFRNHYPKDVDKGASKEDWTHVNDVDEIEEGRYLVSPRNFDQVIVVNRSTKEIEMRLGADDNHEILNEQHNPDYLEGPNGTPTILVADSDNDRIVEYERDCGEKDPLLGAGTPPSECEWNRTWELGDANLNWPRDADRLPNGNTLVTDSMNHRVIEVTPQGEIVWEAFTPWGPYDAERIEYGDGSNGPTIRELGASGSYPVSYAAGNGSRNGTIGDGSTVVDNPTGGNASDATHGGDAAGPQDERVSFPTWLQRTTAGWPGEAAFDEFAETWEGVSQWIKPVWMAPWGFVTLVGALCLSVVWLLAELVYRRQRVYRWAGSLRST